MRPDKILFRPVPVPRNDGRVLPLGAVPVPEYGAQMFARALKKTFKRSNVQTRVIKHSIDIQSLLRNKPTMSKAISYFSSTLQSTNQFS